MLSVSNRRRRFRGVTLVEVIVSAALLAVGLVSAIGGLGAMGRTESRLRQSELLTSLAQQKYDELIATSTSLNTSQSGDFSDQNNPTYTWSASVDQTGVDSLIALTVTVTSTTDTAANAPKGKVCGLIYQPATTTTGATASG